MRVGAHRQRHHVERDAEPLDPFAQSRQALHRPLIVEARRRQPAADVVDAQARRERRALRPTNRAACRPSSAPCAGAAGRSCDAVVCVPRRVTQVALEAPAAMPAPASRTKSRRCMFMMTSTLRLQRFPATFCHCGTSAQLLDLLGPKWHERRPHRAPRQSKHRHQLLHDGDFMSLPPRAQGVERHDVIGHQPMRARRIAACAGFVELQRHLRRDVRRCST